MNQIFHHYEKWEDWKCGFYETLTGDEKKECFNKVVQAFKNPDYTKKIMEKVIEMWPISCEQNFSNQNMNSVAYLGQAAMCIEFGAPSSLTKQAWDSVPLEFQEKANNIAESIINKWNERISKL